MATKKPATASKKTAPTAEKGTKYKVHSGKEGHVFYLGYSFPKASSAYRDAVKITRIEKEDKNDKMFGSLDPSTSITLSGMDNITNKWVKLYHHDAKMLTGKGSNEPAPVVKKPAIAAKKTTSSAKKPVPAKGVIHRNGLFSGLFGDEKPKAPTAEKKASDLNEIKLYAMYQIWTGKKKLVASEVFHWAQDRFGGSGHVERKPLSFTLSDVSAICSEQWSDYTKDQDKFFKSMGALKNSVVRNGSSAKKPAKKPVKKPINRNSSTEVHRLNLDAVQEAIKESYKDGKPKTEQAFLLGVRYATRHAIPSIASQDKFNKKDLLLMAEAQAEHIDSTNKR